MNGDEDRIESEAAAWHVASARDDMDWDGFTRWLEADPRHRRMFDEISLTGALLGDHRDLSAEAGEDLREAHTDVIVSLRRPRRWPVWAGVGVAASLAAVMIAGQVIPPRPETIHSGEAMLTVNLGSKSSATLAPHSSLTIGGRDATQLALEGGAYFDIRHDPSRSLRIVAGDVTVTDVGTRFDIRQRPSQLLVEVSAGEVAVQSAALAAPIQLKAGHRLAYDTAASRAVVSGVDGPSVGEWRQGRLSYDSVPLQLVAADLGRYAGVQVVVPQALAERRFSGTLFIGDGDSAIRDLAQLMELDLHRSGDTYRLEPAG